MHVEGRVADGGWRVNVNVSVRMRVRVVVRVRMRVTDAATARFSSRAEANAARGSVQASHSKIIGKGKGN